LDDWSVVPGSAKMLIQEHAALGKIRFCRILRWTWFHQLPHVPGSTSLLVLDQLSNQPIRSEGQMYSLCQV